MTATRVAWMSAAISGFTDAAREIPDVAAIVRATTLPHACPVRFQPLFSGLEAPVDRTCQLVQTTIRIKR